MNRPICYLITIFLCLCVANLSAEIVNIALQKQGATEWTQLAHDAQRTGWTPEVVSTPWRFKWLRSDVDARSQYSMYPITGNGKVYITAANNNVYALNLSNGQNAWAVAPGGTLNSTPAYDPDTQSLFVCSSNGNLYKLNTSNGSTIGTFNAGSALDTAPLIVGDRVYVTANNGTLFAINKNTMQKIWQYDVVPGTWTINRVTAPSYSATRDIIIYCTDQDLHVRAVRSNGTLAWDVKPTVNDWRSWTGGGWTGQQQIEFRHGWPMVADNAGIVLVRLCLGYDSLEVGGGAPMPKTNAEIKQLLINNPQHQAVFALDLDDGSKAFIPAIKNGAYGDGYLGIGPMLCIRTLPNGKQVVYTVYCNGQVCESMGWCDYREDSTIGEMVLDNTTVPGYEAGDCRFFDWMQQGIQTDEQGPISGAGDMVFFAHWDWPSEGIQITDRSDSVGWPLSNPIKGTWTPWVVTENSSGCGCSPGGSSHYCSNNTCAENAGRWGPPGFFVGDSGWHLYPYTIVSSSHVIVKSISATIFVMEHGNPY